MMNRKQFLLNLLGTSVLLKANRVLAKATIVEGAFSLPALPYSFDALEPHIDKLTMEIHHDRHHLAYVNNLNKAVAGTDMEKLSLEALMKDISKYPMAVRNNGGGHWNHSFFWQMMSPKGGGMPKGKLAEAITRDFGSFEKMQEAFNAAATSRFGSGWAWLIVQDGKLKVVSTANQDNPLMDIASDKGKPILALDVWEHAYYLKYQNKRADYVKAFWNVVNWAKVEELFG